MTTIPVVPKSAYQKLVGLEFKEKLRKFSPSNNASIGNKEIKRLLAFASQAGLLERGSQQTARLRDVAYDICTRLVIEYPESDSITKAARVVLSRLGNFPARDLLGPAKKQNEQNVSLLKLEEAIREHENSVSLINGKTLPLTDFQHDLFIGLKKHATLSVSAPTSAGKSFVLSLDVIRRLNEMPGCIMAYVVPTRALIRQVTMDLIETLSHHEFYGTRVLSAPTPIERKEVPDGLVYVLTAERLMTLLYPSEGITHIDCLFVDEAHELEDKQRGMILHSAISGTIRKFPNAKIFFSSPLTRNPEFLLSEFGLDEGSSIKEFSSPVNQTLVYISKVKRQRNQLQVVLFSNSYRFEFGTITVPFSFATKVSRLASVAFHFTKKDETSVVYANGPKEAQTLAALIAANINENTAGDTPEIKELCDYIKSHVHPEYILLDLLPKGVAYHYGQMPSLVKTRIEELVKAGVIRFICCTSTLLQGVNLPAKNIFIQSPRKGNGNPMVSADFWNLAGRAGRLRKTFNGHVWCLDVDSWQNKPDEEDRYSVIKSAFRETLADDSEKVLVVAKNREIRTTGSAEEQAFAKIFSEFTLLGKTIKGSDYLTKDNKANLADLDKACDRVKAEIHLPLSILEKNSSISPWCLQRLYAIFYSTAAIESFIPQHPGQGSYESLLLPFKLIDTVLLNDQTQRFTFHAWIAGEWVSSVPLKNIIESRISYKGLTNRDAINDEIRSVLETLEKTIHFKYVKYTRAYIDTLGFALEQRKMNSLLTKIPPLHIFLEFGSFDEVTLSLMSVGLTRTTAILLRSSVGKKWPPLTSWQDLQTLLKGKNLTNLMPNLCITEIRELVRL